MRLRLYPTLYLRVICTPSSSIITITIIITIIISTKTPANQKERVSEGKKKKQARKMPKFYGAGRWDPKLILLQITCMQVREPIQTRLRSRSWPPLCLSGSSVLFAAGSNGL